MLILATSEYYSIRKTSGKNSNGLMYHCKKCEKLRKKSYYKITKKRQIERAKAYNQKNLKRSAENARKRYAVNPQKRINNVKWKSENKDKVSLHYAKKNAKRRSSINSTIEKITLSQWNNIKENQDNKCFYCKKEKKLTQDHVIPLSRGGDHSANNIVAACRECNTSKFNHSIEEFAIRKGVVSFG
jgi:5-methylcytosine-specific restriction endonuclease McrA